MIACTVSSSVVIPYHLHKSHFYINAIDAIKANLKRLVFKIIVFLVAGAVIMNRVLYVCCFRYSFYVVFT